MVEKEKDSGFYEHAQAYLHDLKAALEAIPCEAVEKAAKLIRAAGETGHRLFLFGNGGGAALAAHLACDLLKAASRPKNFKFKVHALGGNVALLTALANDLGFESVFVEELRSLIEPGDVCIVFSTSGLSENVLEAARFARAGGAYIIAICGNGGELASISDVAITLPSGHKGRLEDLQCVVGHILSYFFLENSA